MTPTPDYDLRLGDYRATLDGETWDALICDPPFGKRTHDGNSKAKLVDRFAHGDDAPRTALCYEHWTGADVHAFVAWAAPRTRSWMVCFTSHDLISAYENAYAAAGRLCFAPVPFLQHRPRLANDGPGSGTCYIMVARPRHKRFLTWGSLPCWYGPIMAPAVTQKDYHPGGKPLSIMDAIVGDYSRPGDVVCDPTAGGATTLLAAVRAGRKALGSERDPDTHAKASARLSTARALPLFDAPQTSLFETP